MYLYIFIFLNYYNYVSAYNTKSSCQDLNRVGIALFTLKNPQKKIISPNDLHYILFTNDYPIEEIPIGKTTKYLINPQIETKILISGWLEKYNEKWIFDLRDIYLQKGQFNIIIFNWDKYTETPYIYATKLSEELGENLGNFLVDLVENAKLNLDKIHIIAHSLGAQIAGFTGQRISKKLNRKVGRITALDAAGPIFNLNPESYRLDKNDANFVDAIHTNNFLFGYKKPLGNVDILVNNAIFQPGCLTFKNLIKSLSCDLIRAFVFCSHAKSREVWMKSLKTNLIAHQIFTGNPIIVGENIPRNSSGLYRLKINFS